MPSFVAKRNIVRLPPRALSTVPNAIDKWYASLTPQDRGLVKHRILSVINSLPPTKRREVEAKTRKIEATKVAGGGLGSVGMMAGGIGSMVGGLLGSGIDLWKTKEMGKIQSDIAGKQMQTDLMMSMMNGVTQKEMQKVMSDTQIEAAKLASLAQTEAQKEAGLTAREVAKIQAQAQVMSAQTAAQKDIIKAQGSAAFWDKYGTLAIAGGIGVVALGLLGTGVVLFKKKKRSKTTASSALGI